MPALDPAIPHQIALAERVGLDRRIAEALCALGWLDADDLGAAESVEHGIERGLIRRLLPDGAPENYHLGLSITNALDGDGIGPKRDLRVGLQVDLTLDEIGEVVIGRRLMAMTGGDIRPARTIVRLIDAIGLDTVPLFTPGVAEMIAISRHWMGTDSPREAYYDLMSGGEDPRDFEVLTTQAIYGRMPRWLCDACTGAPKDLFARGDPLARWRDRLPGTLLAGLDHALAAHAALDAKSWQEPDGDTVLAGHEDVGPTYCTLLRWHHDDPLPRLFDDWAEDAQQLGLVGLVTQRAVDLTDPENAARQLEQLRRILYAARALDRVLALLTGD